MLTHRHRAGRILKFVDCSAGGIAGDGPLAGAEVAPRDAAHRERQDHAEGDLPVQWVPAKHGRWLRSRQRPVLGTRNTRSWGDRFFPGPPSRYATDGAPNRASRGCSSMAEPQPSKLVMRVRFPSSAPAGESRFSKAPESRKNALGPSAGQIIPAGPSPGGRRGRAGRGRQRSFCRSLWWRAGRSWLRAGWSGRAGP
jgi:hypothetical protein